MMILFYFSFILIVPLTHGNTVKDKVLKTDTTTTLLSNTHDKPSNKTKVTIASEGGAIVSNPPALSLPGENQAIIMAAENVNSSNKIVARKGAPLNQYLSMPSEDSESENLNVMKQNSSTSKSHQNTQNIEIANVGIKAVDSNLNSSELNITVHHKPTIVSAEAIAKSDELNSNPVLDDVKERNLKIQKINSSGHPGMVMPIVITILVVPMFAVLGYMVLKRGQEAWKNRHYKRMDFLLDGMYND